MPVSPPATAFAQRLMDWQHRYGRHDLPWQASRDAYRVWLSEIMLQQTQVSTVIPYYERFLARFAHLAALAAAPVEDVMSAWSGLGYYARARNLHACARLLVTEHGGAFPADPELIAELPGIGRSTANAIAVFCFGARRAILDGNVKRLLCRHVGIQGFPGQPAVARELWRLAESLLPATGVGTYIQAQMDLGAAICTRSKPRCARCPVAEDCSALRNGRTAELPTGRPRRALPERETTVLLLRHGNRTLLEARPPAGIWGGLLSLPELPIGVAPSEHAASLGCRLLATETLPTVSHAFTHFLLRLKPLDCTVEPLPLLAEPTCRWLTPAEWAAAALPAPIRRLLHTTGRD
jgi:A/G-specific adenine glycosylase